MKKPVRKGCWKCGFKGKTNKIGICLKCWRKMTSDQKNYEIENNNFKYNFQTITFD